MSSQLENLFAAGKTGTNDVTRYVNTDSLLLAAFYSSLFLFYPFPRPTTICA